MVIIGTPTTYTPDQLRELINAGIDQYVIDHPNNGGGNPTDIIQQFIINNPFQFKLIVLDYFNGDSAAAVFVIRNYFNGHESEALEIIQYYFSGHPDALQTIIDAYLQVHPQSAPRYLSFSNDSDQSINYSVGIPNEVPRLSGSILPNGRFNAIFLPTEVYVFANIEVTTTTDLVMNRFLRYDGVSSFETQTLFNLVDGLSHSFFFSPGVNAVGISEKVDYDMYHLRHDSSQVDTNGSYSEGYAQYPIDHPPVPQFYQKRGALEVHNYCASDITISALKADGSVFTTITLEFGNTNNTRYFDYNFFDDNLIERLRLDADNVQKDIMRSEYHCDTNQMTHLYTDMSFTYDLIYYPDLRCTLIIIPKPIVAP